MKHRVRDVIMETIRQHRLLFVGILCTVAGAIVLALLPPIILGKMIDGLMENATLSLWMVVLYYGFLVLTGAFESLREILITVFGQKITHALRSRLMDKYTRLTTAQMVSQESGTVVSRFVGDVDTVEDLFSSGIVSMFADACKIISILWVIGFRTPGLALILLVLLPFLFGFTRIVQKRMLEAQIANRRAVGKASGMVPETIHNIRTIHCLGQESYMEQRYDGAILDSFRAVGKNNFYDAIYSPVILILNAIVVAVTMILTASGNPVVLQLFGMSAGTAVAVMNYIAQIFAPVESLGMEIQTIQSAIAGVHRINEFLALPEKHWAEMPAESEAGSERISIQTKAVPCVQFQGVTFRYDSSETEVLKEFDFTLQEGEKVTLSGRTGAGKSTIFKLLLGLYEPTSGKVLIEGHPATEIPASRRRRLFGYVEQSFHMVPGTVKEQITLYDSSIGMEAVRRAARMVGIDSAIENLERGYDTPCTQELFSQGQWQLLSIARATVANPKILLLDEITANLDVKTEQEVLQALNRSMENRTVLSISHRTNAKTGRVIELG